nr:HlyC/CorC family transporter [Eubacterium sp.]
MENHTTSIVIIVFCTIMSAYFSATETAFSSLNRIRIKNMAEKGNKRAALVLRMSENFDSLLSTILIGNNIVNIASASLATVLFVSLLGNDIGPSMSTLVTTIVVLIFGEVTPKSIAKESPETFAMFSAPFLNALVKLLTPANFLFGQWKKVLNLIIKSSDDDTITEEELLTIVEEAEQGGGIDKEESVLIQNAIEFNELEALDILTPRVDVVAISKDTSKEEIAKLFTNTGYSRLPVYEENIDNIVGILYQKDFYNYMYPSDETLENYIRPVLFITKNRNVGDLLKELQSQKMHIAVILDEFGCTVGIITLEDILEELVGDIWDEHDTIEHEIEVISDNEYLVSGKANIENLLDELGNEEETDVMTVGGWVMKILHRIPTEGDTFTKDNLEVKVEKMNGRRIEKVYIKKLEVAEEESE